MRLKTTSGFVKALRAWIFGATMRPFVKLLWPLVANTRHAACSDQWQPHGRELAVGSEQLSLLNYVRRSPEWTRASFIYTSTETSTSISSTLPGLDRSLLCVKRCTVRIYKYRIGRCERNIHRGIRNVTVYSYFRGRHHHRRSLKRVRPSGTLNCWPTHAIHRLTMVV